MENLEAAQSWVEWLRSAKSKRNQTRYAAMVTAYATLAIAEKLYEEKDVLGFEAERKVVKFLTGIDIADSPNWRSEKVHDMKKDAP